MLLLFAPVPCFLLIATGAFLVRNGLWLFAWMTYSIVLTATVAHSLEGVTDGLASGPIIAFVLTPMILAIIISFLPALMRIDSKGDVPLSRQNLIFPLIYATIISGAFLWLANAA